MRVICTEQRTPAWYQARLGRLTSSSAAEMLAKIKSGEAAGRRNLRMRLVLERLTGRSQESTYVSPAMQQGEEREADAAAIYEALTGVLLDTTGFLAHDDLMAGCSPDGLVNSGEGLVEIKSPLAATHLGYLKTGVVPDEYLKQIQHQLWITGAQWCDWLSYNPDFPEPLRVKLVRVVRNDAELHAYELLVRLFLDEVDREVGEVQKLADAAGVAA